MQRPGVSGGRSSASTSYTAAQLSSSGPKSEGYIDAEDTSGHAVNTPPTRMDSPSLTRSGIAERTSIAYGAIAFKKTLGSLSLSL